MPILRQNFEIKDLNNRGSSVILSYTDMVDFNIVNSYEIEKDDGSIGIVEGEFCEVTMKDGESHIFKASLFDAVCMCKNFIRFQVANVIDLKMDKIFVKYYSMY